MDAFRLSLIDAPARFSFAGAGDAALAEAAGRSLALGAPQIFWRNAKALGLAARLPAAAARALAEAERRALVNGLYWRQALRALLSAVTPSGVRLVPLKGLSLIARIYGDESLRMTSDLDVLIRGGDFDACRLALEGAGYRLRDAASNGVLPNHGQESVWLGPDGGEVDLHTRLFCRHDEDFLCKIDSAAILERAEAQEWDGFPVKLLRLEDEFVYLLFCAESGRAARYYFDLDALAFRRGESLDWDGIGAALSRSPLAARLFGVLRSLDGWGTPLPDAIRDRARRAPDLPPLERGARPRGRMESLALAAPADKARLAAEFFKWRVFKATGLFRGHFIRRNNPVPRAF